MPTTEFPSVGVFNDSYTGVLISPTHVLTAAQATSGRFRLDGTFALGGENYGIRQVYDGPAGRDLAIVELDRAVVGITPSEILRTAPTVGQSLTLVGFGDTGTTFGVKYAGTTLIDEVTNEQLRWTVDNDQQAGIAWGDVGGPGFVNLGGTLLVAGIASDVFSQPLAETRVDALASFVDDVLGGSYTIPDDYGDSPQAGAASLAFVDDAATAQGLLEDPHDRDAFTFTIVEPSVAQIDLRHATSGLDMILRLYDSSGSSIGADDDGGGNLDSRLVRFLQPGTYYLTAADLGQNSTGQYDVKVQSWGLPPVDEAPSLPGPEAPSLAFDAQGRATVHAGLQTDADADVFQFSVSDRTNLEIEAGSRPAFYLQTSLLDATGAPVDEEEGFGGSLLSGIPILHTLDPGTYYVRAAASYGDLGLYDLHLSLLAIPPDPEPAAPDPAAPALTLDSSGRGSYTGVLQTTGDRDALRLTIESRSELSLRMNATSAAVLPQLRFYDKAGVLLADTGAYDGDASLQWLVVEPGEYFVEASAVDDADIGAYRVSVTATPDSPTEPVPHLEVDEAGSASRISAIAAGSRDLTSFTLPQQTWTRIELQRAGAELDPYLRLYDGSGQLIGSDDDSGGSVNSRLERSLPAGTYYVSAGDYGDNDPGEYQVLLQMILDDHPYPPGDPGIPPIPVPPSGDVALAGSIDFPGDQDAFRFDLPDTADVRFDLTSSAFDDYLELYDGNLNLIAHDDDAGGNGNASISRRALEPGTYFIVARPWNGSGTGTYSLSVHAVWIPDPEGPVLPDLTATGAAAVEGGLQYVGDTDGFNFDVLKRTVMQFDLAARNGGNLDPFLRVVDRDTGATVAFDDNSGGSAAARLRLTLPAGHYSVVAEAFGDLSMGDYLLEATMSIGDFNGDGKVDLADFGILKQHFGSPGGPGDGDGNLDGTVNLADFGILKSNFGSRREDFVARPPLAALGAATVPRDGGEIGGLANAEVSRREIDDLAWQAAVHLAFSSLAEEDE